MGATSSGDSQETFGLTYSEVAEIIKLLQTMECVEVDLEFGDVRIRVRRRGAEKVEEGTRPSETDASRLNRSLAAGPAEGAMEGKAATREVRMPPAATSVEKDISSETDLSAGESALDENQLVAVKAPIVGNFYRAPAPGEKAFVEEGDIVKKGSTVGIIEVMKLMNEIKSELSGRVEKIEAANAELVEYGQPLMWIRPGEQA